MYIYIYTICSNVIDRQSNLEAGQLATRITSLNIVDFV